MGDKKIATFSEDDFHHLGYACFDIKTEVKNFSFLGYKMEGSTFRDEVQGVAGCFLEGPGPRIELLENLPGSETLSPWIESRPSLYHLAYYVDDIYGSLTWAKENRFMLLNPPKPSIAFGGRLICFCMMRNKLMLELIERDGSVK